MIKLIKSFFVVFAAITIAVLSTGAFLSDTETSSGNSITAGTWPNGPITITEVFYDAVGTDTGLEFIELQNRGTYTANLTGYVLHINDGGTNDLIFPNIALLPNQKLVVHVNSSGTNTSSDYYWANGQNMGNTSGSVVLFNSLPKDSTTIVDFVQYGAANQGGEAKAIAAVPPIWVDDAFVVDVAAGHSIALSGADNNLVGDWVDLSTPTPGI